MLTSDLQPISVWMCNAGCVALLAVAAGQIHSEHAASLVEFSTSTNNTDYDDNSLIVESGQSSEALHQHGLPKQREWSGGGHCQCLFALLRRSL